MRCINLFQVAITYNCNKSCSYCFAENFRGRYKDMSLDSFKELLGWLEKNNISSFNFTGGEPTLHPRIKDFVKIAYDKGFKFNIFTNGLFNENLINNFKKVNSFLINYNPKEHYTEREYLLLHKNLENLSKEKIKSTIMFNISENIDSCSHILKACSKYKIKDVMLDLIIPNSLKSNQFIDTKHFQNKKAMLLDFMKQLRDKKIKLRISRPMPRCMFTKKEYEKLKQHNEVYHKCGTGSTIIAVNPDLKTFPCLSIFFRGPRITNFKDVFEYRQFYKKSIPSLQWKRMLYPKCKSCIYFLRKQCQNSCLCHKCRDFNIIKSDSYSIYSQYNQAEINEFIKKIDEGISSLSKIFGSINKKINIYLFDNKQELLFYSGAYHYPDWVGGFASSDLTYYQYGPKAHKRITHELCHLYLQYFSNNKIPTWLSEGFCEYINFQKDNKEELNFLLKKKKLLSFEKLLYCGKMSLLKYDQDPLDKNICYHQSHNLVRYLIDNFGSEKVMNLLNGRYDDFYKFFLTTIGKDFFEIEKEWRESLNDE